MSDQSSHYPEIEAGREGLLAWEREKPKNFFDSDSALQQGLEFYWGKEIYDSRRDDLSRFGGIAATALNQAVILSNRDENLPRLERYSPLGERIENVVFHPSYHEAGRMIYASGVMASHREPGRELERMALFYLSSQNGESGHNCPLACTAGVIKTIQRLGSAEIKARFLPRLLDPDYDRLIHGAQFLTEVQGGSDVGANGTRAEPVEGQPGLWKIWGEKWFCSNVTAELALITARPINAGSGTSGLGLFLVPRHLDDGRPNAISIRRLKYKLGTRSMASAELDFNGALAHELGSPEEGFRNMMEIVIGASRLYNAAGCAGLARRAYYEAHTYATHRSAFGGPIIRFPLVKESLARMRTHCLAMTAAGLFQADLEDRLEKNHTEEDLLFRRFLLNLMKTMTSRMAVQLIRDAIGILGGNGAIEEFSVLPRLLRDSIVFENWEGTHHVLQSQILRDMGKFHLGELFLRRVGAMIAELDAKILGATRDALLACLDQLPDQMREVLQAEPAGAPLIAQDVLDRMGFLFQAACLAREAQWSLKNKNDDAKLHALRFLIAERLSERPSKSGKEYAELVAHLSAGL